MNRAEFREKTRRVLFVPETPEGRAFGMLLFSAIVISVTLSMIDSVKSIHETHGGWLSALNATFSILFTVEYAARLYCAKRPARYARSFFGVVDLLAILPFYVGMIVPEAQFLDVIKVLRVLRIFRILKMAQYVGEADLLKNALVESRRKIGIFFVAVLTIVTILGSLMYIIEGEANGFTSIPRSVYWAIVTLTTVGYGDISPQTNLGQFISALIMVIGYSIIAVPTGVITADIAVAKISNSSKRSCGACGKSGHATDAKFCKYCGAAL